MAQRGISWEWVLSVNLSTVPVAASAPLEMLRP